MTIIETRGVEHRIEFQVDHVNNEPKITHTTEPSAIKVGTQDHGQVAAIQVGRGRRGLGADDFKELAETYVWFNPHLTLRGTWRGQQIHQHRGHRSGWEKWRPRNPTSAHWYDKARLQRYLAAHVARDRELRAASHGPGVHRRVSRAVRDRRPAQGARRGRLLASVAGAFFGVEQVNRKGIAKLLASMCKHSKPVAPKHLGIIGADHLKQRFLAAGGNADTFKYQHAQGHDERRHSLRHRIRVRPASIRA